MGYEVVVTGPNTDGKDKIESLGARFAEVPVNKTGTNPFPDNAVVGGVPARIIKYRNT